MTDVDQTGPVDYVVVELPAGSREFDDEVTRELASLEDVGLIRLLAARVVERSDDGAVAAHDSAALPRLPVDVDVLDGTGLDLVADALDRGRAAGVLVWEHRWSDALARAAASSGGRILDSGRLDTATVLAALATGAEPAPDPSTPHPPEDPRP